MLCCKCIFVNYIYCKKKSSAVQNVARILFLNGPLHLCTYMHIHININKFTLILIILLFSFLRLDNIWPHNNDDFARIGPSTRARRQGICGIEANTGWAPRHTGTKTILCYRLYNNINQQLHYFEVFFITHTHKYLYSHTYIHKYIKKYINIFNYNIINIYTHYSH